MSDDFNSLTTFIFQQGHMFAGSAHAQGAMNLQGAQSFYHYGAQGLHPYYMTPR